MARGKQARVFVPVGRNRLSYGFKWNEDRFNAYGGTLGVQLANGVFGVFFGANSPKPPKAKRKFTSGSVQSFYDEALSRQLSQAGWTLSNGDGTQGIRTSGRAVTVIVETPFNYDYAWNIPVGEVDRAISLGAKRPTDTDRMVWGSSPKPPRYTKKENDGQHSSYLPPDLVKIREAIEKGYSVTSPEPEWNLN